jgi:formylglycine-generating enzyme required for sulfatase activity
MVAIPPGEFTMGSPPSEAGRADDEGPQHRVFINSAFALGRFDVTRRQFAPFAREAKLGHDAKCDWADPKLHGVSIQQRDDEPVVCVTWDEADAYAVWLSTKTGHPYRLPSEAEWEYAARAGTVGARPWGDAPLREHANFGSDACCGPAASGADKWLYTSPVGSFPPNSFGLHDMLGNVWQWTNDCAEIYLSGSSDASSSRTRDCSRRMLRGGAWFQGADSIRSAARANDDRTFRAADIGFRLARDVERRQGS